MDKFDLEANRGSDSLGIYRDSLGIPEEEDWCLVAGFNYFLGNFYPGNPRGFRIPGSKI